jgi:hypothetical protein
MEGCHGASKTKGKAKGKMEANPEVMATTMDEKIGSLVEQFAALKVIEALRHSHTMPLPDAESVIEFDKLASLMMNQRILGSQKVHN